MTNLRFEAVEAASHKQPVKMAARAHRPSAYFGKYVFNREKMYQYLPVEVYKKSSGLQVSEDGLGHGSILNCLCHREIFRIMS